MKIVDNQAAWAYAAAAGPNLRPWEGEMGPRTTTGDITVSSTELLRERARESLRRCGAEVEAESATLQARSPITGENLFGVATAGRDEVESAIAAAKDAFMTWRT